jgi:hypothetical protein
MDQNKNVENNRKIEKVKLDPAIISDLRASHFTLGHEPTLYNSIARTQFVDKSNNIYQVEDNGLDGLLKKQSYVLGNSRVDYRSEMDIKYPIPDKNANARYEFIY